MTVSLETGEKDVEKPETEEKECCEDALCARAAQLSTDVRPAPVQQDAHRQEGKDGEEGDRKCQGTCWHLELTTLHVPVDGGHWPRHTDSQENVHGVATGHVSDRRVRVTVLHRWNFTGKGVWGEKKDADVDAFIKKYNDLWLTCIKIKGIRFCSDLMR